MSTTHWPIAVTATLVLLVAGCSHERAAPARPVTRHPSTSLDGGFAPTPTTGCAATSDASVRAATGDDPYTAAGARQRPGPSMTAAPAPVQPVTVQVGRPPNPDEHVAARQPDGVATATASPGTSTAAPTPTTPGGCASPSDASTGDDGP